MQARRNRFRGENAQHREDWVAEQRDLSDETRQQLEAMGYLEEVQQREKSH